MEATMKKYLSEDAYESFKSAIHTGKKIDRNTADQVAAAMKSWAIEKERNHIPTGFNL